MNKFLAAIIVSSCFFACSNTEQERVIIVDEKVVEDVNLASKEEIVEEDTEEQIIDSSIISFNQATARIAKNANNFDITISNNYGVYVITQPGAMPKVEHKYQLDLKTFSSEIIFEELPKFSCDSHSFDKQGCFAQEINPLHESQLWNYTGLNEKEKQAIIAQSETIKYTIVDTQNKITYYFSKIEGQWFLTFVDLRTPCEA